MQYKNGMNVVGVGGEKAGEVDRVVIDPRSGEVTDIVVRSGFLFKTDKVIPVDRVTHTTEDEMKLNITADEADEFPDFVETTYVMTDERERTRLGYEYGADANLATPYYWYPYGSAGMGMWGRPLPSYPAAYTYPYQRRELENIPEGTVPLKQGAKVTGVDGKDVGSLERVITNSENDEVTHLVITKGMLNREKKMVPANWINHVTEEKVELAVNADFVDTLKDFKED